MLLHKKVGPQTESWMLPGCYMVCQVKWQDPTFLDSDPDGMDGPVVKIKKEILVKKEILEPVKPSVPATPPNQTPKDAKVAVQTEEPPALPEWVSVFPEEHRQQLSTCMGVLRNEANNATSVAMPPGCDPVQFKDEDLT